MNDFIKTVTVLMGHGPVRVNAADYNPAMGEIIAGEAENPVAAMAAARADQVQDGYKEAADTLAKQNALQAAEIDALRAQLAGQATAPAPGDVLGAAGDQATAAADALTASLGNSGTAQQPPAVVAPVYLVAKKKNRHMVVDDKGAAVVSDLISADGYATEGEAWAAIMLINKPA